MKPAKTKRDYYEKIAAVLAPLWEQDARMMEADPARWQQVRDLDAALVADRENPAVSVAAYRIRCLALEQLYSEHKEVRHA